MNKIKTGSKLQTLITSTIINSYYTCKCSVTRPCNSSHLRLTRPVSGITHSPYMSLNAVDFFTS